MQEDEVPLVYQIRRVLNVFYKPKNIRGIEKKKNQNRLFEIRTN